MQTLKNRYCMVCQTGIIRTGFSAADFRLNSVIRLANTSRVLAAPTSLLSQKSAGAELLAPQSKRFSDDFAPAERRILLRRNAGNSLHIVKFRLCKSAEKNCPEAGSYYSGLASEENIACRRRCRTAPEAEGRERTRSDEKREDKKKDGQRPSCHLCAVLPFVPPLFVSDHSETVHRTREARLRGIKLHAALFV